MKTYPTMVAEMKSWLDMLPAAMRVTAALFAHVADALESAPAFGPVEAVAPVPSTGTESPPFIATGALAPVTAPIETPAPEVPAPAPVSSGAILGGQ